MQSPTANVPVTKEPQDRPTGVQGLAVTVTGMDAVSTVVEKPAPTPRAVTVTVLTPGATALTKPVALTVATDEALDV